MLLQIPQLVGSEAFQKADQQIKLSNAASPFTIVFRSPVRMSKSSLTLCCGVLMATACFALSSDDRNSGAITDETKKQAVAATVLIRTPTGGGSGFVIEDAGRKFIVTNQHVLLGAKQGEVEIVTAQGTKLPPLALEIVPEQDLARIVVKDAPPGLALVNEANIDDMVATVGNSLDAGVTTLNAGTIKGIGASEIEVDCEVVPGQSGGPLINKDGQVLGVTTYILFADSDRTAAGTRYAQKRYFIVRIGSNTKWTQVTSWPDYTMIGLKVQAGVDIFERSLDIARSADDRPRKEYHYTGRDSKLAEAVTHHNRFAAKMTKMNGEVVTSSELKRNNDSLGTSFRQIYKSIIEATKQAELALQSEINSGRPQRYPWLAGRAEETAKMLFSLARSLESRSKARPNFLTW